MQCWVEQAPQDGFNHFDRRSQTEFGRGTPKQGAPQSLVLHVATRRSTRRNDS